MYVRPWSRYTPLHPWLSCKSGCLGFASPLHPPTRLYRPSIDPDPSLLIHRKHSTAIRSTISFEAMWKESGNSSFCKLSRLNKGRIDLPYRYRQKSRIIAINNRLVTEKYKKKKEKMVINFGKKEVIKFAINFFPLSPFFSNRSNFPSKLRVHKVSNFSFFSYLHKTWDIARCDIPRLKTDHCFDRRQLSQSTY